MNEFIAAVLGATISIYVMKHGSNDDLDTSSKWRESLLNTASKFEFEVDDVQRVRSSLRMLPHNEYLTRYSFEWFTDLMILHLDKILEEPKLYFNKNNNRNSDESNKKVLKEEQTRIVRLFANLLLKYHFEYRKYLGPKDIIFASEKNKRYNQLVYDVYNEYQEYVKTGDINMTKAEEIDRENNSKKNKLEKNTKLLISLIFFVVGTLGIILLTKLDSKTGIGILLMAVISLLFSFLIDRDSNSDEKGKFTTKK
ncbi:TPA: hypothetical protein VA887_000347 [Streptococcus agalactiae]|nr:hypothetical protein [Streptococcus agalactiae]